MYIILVGPPGKCRKGVAMGTALDLIKHLPHVKISADAMTKEALTQTLKDCERDEGEVPGKKGQYIHSSLTIVSKELAVFLGSNNPDLLSLLTDLFDCHDKWTYRTKRSGTDDLTGEWLNILGASTPIWLVGSVPLSAIGGGFTSRVIFIVEEDVRRKTSFPKLTERELRLRDALKADLEAITMLRGEFKLTPDAEEFYDKWYTTNNPKIDDVRFWGYSERKHVHLLKASLLIAVSEGSDGVIKPNHIERALDMINVLEPQMVNAFGSAGRSRLAADIDDLLTNIKRAGVIERSQLIKATCRDVDPAAFKEVMTTLYDLHYVTSEVDKLDGKTYYKYIGDEEVSDDSQDTKS